MARLVIGRLDRVCRASNVGTVANSAVSEDWGVLAVSAVKLVSVGSTGSAVSFALVVSIVFVAFKESTEYLAFAFFMLW